MADLLDAVCGVCVLSKWVAEGLLTDVVEAV